MAKTILVVDSDQAVLEQVKSALAGRYRIWSYRDPQAALKAVAEGLLPQLVLCSLRMPGMAGLDFKRELQSTARLGGVPVIFMVGYREEKLFDRVLPAERKRRLLKPFGQLELQALADSYLTFPTQF